MFRALIVNALVLVFVMVAKAIPAEKFYARKDFQDVAPGAFVLQSEAADFVAGLAATTTFDVGALVGIVRERQALWSDLQNLRSLDRERFRSALKQVHDLEIRLFGIAPPRLRFDDSYPRAAYFEFRTDDENDPGTIILNLTDPYMVKNPYSALSLLVHETRHAYQLAWARRRNDGAFDRRIAWGFYNSFRAQEQLKGFTFLDFCTLTNEFEAFQFASLFIGRLTDFSVSDVSLGSYASQFNGDGSLKIDLVDLHRTFFPTTPATRERSEMLYREFNRFEEAQFLELNRN